MNAGTQAHRHAGTQAGPHVGDAPLSPGGQRVVPSSLRPAFTLIELLVVIVVIGILIAAIGLIGAKVHGVHKVKATESTMRILKMGIDEFATLNPLAGTYDQKDPHKTFGPYPPYMLDDWGNANDRWSVQRTLESSNSYDPNNYGFSYVLPDRLHRDIANRQGNVSAYVGVAPDDHQPHFDSNDDIRALYAYLKLHVPDAVAQLPKDVLRPITVPGKVNFVDPSGSLLGGTQNAFDVLGIYDAWGVPLNYFLYVKLEWTFDPVNGQQWMVTNRVPVVMSRGISAEEYKAEQDGTDALDPQKYIFSDPFPSPAAAGVDRTTGAISCSAQQYSQCAGWARARAAGDEYDYVP